MNDDRMVIIPAFNEAKVISNVITDLQSSGIKNILVVDDGSIDDTSVISKRSSVLVARHILNRGKGAATQTGFDIAKVLGNNANIKYVVTIDGDGQHDVLDVIKIFELLSSENIDVVLGSRFLKDNNIPFKKKIANKVGNFLTFLFYGTYVSDSQSGLRGYNINAINQIQTTFDRYEFESEIIHQIKVHKLRYKEIQINVRYTHYSQNKYNHLKGFEAQKLMNGFNMIFRMVIKSITS